MAGDLATRRLRVFYVGTEASRSPLIPRLQALGRAIDEAGLGEAGGVVSARAGKRVLVSTGTARLAALRRDDFVEIVDYDAQRHRCLLMGKAEPPQYAGIHWLIYNHREEVGGIVQVQDPVVADVQEATQMFPETGDRPLGSVDLAVEALKLLRKSPFFVLTGHGSVATGKDIGEAMQVALRAREEALSVVEEAAMGEEEGDADPGPSGGAGSRASARARSR